MQAVKNHFKGNGLAANGQEFCQQTLQLVAVKLDAELGRRGQLRLMMIRHVARYVVCDRVQVLQKLFELLARKCAMLLEGEVGVKTLGRDRGLKPGRSRSFYVLGHRSPSRITTAFDEGKLCAGNADGVQSGLVRTTSIGSTKPIPKIIPE